MDPTNESLDYVTLGGIRSARLALNMSNPEPRAWENIGAGLPDVGASSLVVDPKDPKSLYVTADEGRFHLLDGGVAWPK